jgi:GH15 family glucan-1,4-alpha-glucosidase
MRIEGYGLIGDTQAAALVGFDGSIDWLCMPRFDSHACFSAVLAEPSDGRWLIAAVEEPRSRARRYRGPSLVLETDFITDSGSVRLIDCMPLRDQPAELAAGEQAASKVIQPDRLRESLQCSDRAPPFNARRLSDLR